jgi:site-specific DNA-methyltransferase (adenine-specific)
MKYLIKLISPPNTLVLDPFMGSGSTGKALLQLNKELNKNYSFIGIELNEEYFKIAAARVAAERKGK